MPGSLGRLVRLPPILVAARQPRNPPHILGCATRRASGPHRQHQHRHNHFPMPHASTLHPRTQVATQTPKPLQRKICFERWHPLCHLLPVRSVKTMLALMLALAWAPLMWHCNLETVPALKFLRCVSVGQPAGSVPGHCDGASCCAVESGKYQAPSHQQIVPVFTLALLSFDVVADSGHSSPPQITLGLLTAAPPELSSTWQFTFRTAPPSRAPSLVS